MKNKTLSIVSRWPLHHILPPPLPFPPYRVSCKRWISWWLCRNWSVWKPPTTKSPDCRRNLRNWRIWLISTSPTTRDSRNCRQVRYLHGSRHLYRSDVHFFSSIHGVFRCAVASLSEVSVRPSVCLSVPCYFRRWKVRILGASCAVYPALFVWRTKVCHISLGIGRGCERGGEQMRRGRRGAGRTRKRDAEWNQMAPRGQGAVAVPISDRSTSLVIVTLICILWIPN